IDASSSKGQRLFRDADEGIALEDKHWVFSVDNVCEMLDINPEYLRRGLTLWKQRKLEALERAALARLEAAANPVIMVEEPMAAVAPVRATETAKPAAPRTAKVFAPRRQRSHAGNGKVAPARGRAAARSLRKARA
ncbi:MAG: hypothetical protein ACREQC_01300, partial [Candidatus Binataceae bacterium]